MNYLNVNNHTLVTHHHQRLLVEPPAAARVPRTVPLFPLCYRCILRMNSGVSDNGGEIER